MKILQLGKFYPIRGGVEKVMYDLMIGLSDQGIHCDMLCASTEDYPAGDLIINGFSKVIVVPTKIKLAATMLAPSMIFKLRSICEDYDIIHIHHPDPMAALSLFLSGFKGKVILHWHSDILKQKKLLKIYGPLQSWLINRADLIVGTTPVYVQQTQFLQEVQSKIDYIPIGVSRFEVNEDLAQKILSKNKGKFLVFSLGRLVEYKGYEYLIKSAQYLTNDHKIIIGGKGPLDRKLRDLIIKLKVQDRVELLGFISDEEAYAYFKACDTFVLSSILKTEAFGIVQIEAMSYAKPIISTNIPGSGVSWVNRNEETGFVIPICDEKAIADAILSLSNDSSRYELMSLASLNRYEEQFTSFFMVDKCLQLYKKILQLS